MTAFFPIPWPDVDCDQYGQITCPTPTCDAELHLIREYAIPLIAEQDTDNDVDAAISDTWRVECTNSHVLHTSADQARATGEDETSDTAIEYDHRFTHDVIHQLGGGRA